MKKVGLVICYFHINYGSMLQAYATQYTLDKMNVENEAVFCNDPHMYMTMNKWEYYFHKLTDPELVADKIRRTRGKIFHRFFKTDFYEKQKLRNHKFEEFSADHFRVSKPYKNRNELVRDADNYGAFIVGSDQLWSAANIDNDFYTLTFVPDHIPRIAYATSFGTSKLPAYQHRKAKEFLERFDALSVREESGRKIIKALTGRDARVVLDPTLLLEREDWEKLAGEQPVLNEKYIFCYFLGANSANREFASRLRQKTGYRIAALLHMDEYVRSDEGFADYAMYDIGPAEFVNLIRNAQYVCTDSFHGTVFSIIFEKQFFTFNRFRKGSSISTNTRIDSLLSMLDLEERRKTGGEDVSICMKQIPDYSGVREKLRDRRRESLDYLKSSLENAKNSEKTVEGEVL